MCRRDLPPGYDGWQMVDPTPQDKQSGRYRIGPVPVGAVKQRKVCVCVCVCVCVLRNGIQKVLGMDDVCMCDRPTLPPPPRVSRSEGSGVSM